MSDKKATIIIEAEDRASGALGKVKDNSRKLAEALTVVGAGFSAVGALTVKAVGGFVKAAAEIESQTIAFQTLTKDAELGKKTLKDLIDFAASTPFEIPQILEQSKKLLAYQISAEELIPTFKVLGDIAAGVGMDKLPQLTLAFGQVKSATKLTGNEVRQFTEAGVPLLQALVDKANETGGSLVKVGGASKEMRKLSTAIAGAEADMAYFRSTGEKTEKQLQTMQEKINLNKDRLMRLGPAAAVSYKVAKESISGMIDKIKDGAVSFEDVNEALSGMAKEDFFNLMGEQVKSTTGKIGNFKDSIFLLNVAMGNTIIGPFKQFLDYLSPLIRQVVAWAEANPKLVQTLVIFAGVLGAIGLIMLAMLPIILLFNAGLLPMTLIIGGIAIAIALVVAAIYYWRDELAAFVEIAKTKFDELMTRLQPVFNKFIEIKDYFVAVFKPLVVEAIEAIRLKFIEWYDKVIEIKNELVKLLDAFSLWFEETFGKSIQDTIKEKLIQSGDDWQSGWTGNIKTMIDVFGFLIEKIGETIRKIGELKNLLENSGPLGQAVLKTFGTAAGAVNPLLGLLSKQHGGIVPGGAGDAVPALLHGGERVVSRTGTDVNTGGSSSGTTVNLIIEGDVNSMDMMQSIVDAVKGALGRDSELAQLGVSI